MEGNLAKRVSTGLRVYTVYLQRWREGRDLVTVLGDEIKINIKRVGVLTVRPDSVLKFNFVQTHIKYGKSIAA